MAGMGGELDLEGQVLAQQVVQDNRTFYHACAPDYDAGREFAFRHERARVADDLQWLGAFMRLEEAVVLDVGCGTGFYASIAAAQGVRQLHCLDFEPAFLELARDKIKATSPQAQVHCHAFDLETFAAERADLLSGIDVYLMGSVLQYVPGHLALIERLARATEHSCFYITSTRLPGGGRHRLLEGLLARLDYALHRLIHPRPARRHGLLPAQVTVEVDLEALQKLFRGLGCRTRCYSYSAFHLLPFNKLHQLLRAAFPSLGACFTLLAARGEGGTGVQKEGKGR